MAIPMPARIETASSSARRRGRRRRKSELRLLVAPAVLQITDELHDGTDEEQARRSG